MVIDILVFLFGRGNSNLIISNYMLKINVYLVLL